MANHQNSTPPTRRTTWRRVPRQVAHIMDIRYRRGHSREASPGALQCSPRTFRASPLGSPWARTGAAGHVRNCHSSGDRSSLSFLQREGRGPGQSDRGHGPYTHTGTSHARPTPVLPTGTTRGVGMNRTRCLGPWGDSSTAIQQEEAQARSTSFSPCGTPRSTGTTGELDSGE